MTANETLYLSECGFHAHLIEMHNLSQKSQMAIFPSIEHMIMMTNPDKGLVQVRKFLERFETTNKTEIDLE